MSLRRLVALVLVLLHLSACTSWQPTMVSPRQFIEEEEPSAVRITRTDGERVTIQLPTARADSIIGETASVAVSDIQLLESRRFSVGRTFIAVVFGGAAIVAAVFAAWIISCGDSHRGSCPS